MQYWTTQLPDTQGVGTGNTFIDHPDHCQSSLDTTAVNSPCSGGYDFFLVSQNVREGTVTPSHYHVIYDTSNLKPDHMQRFVYKYNTSSEFSVARPLTPPFISQTGLQIDVRVLQLAWDHQGPSTLSSESADL